MNEATALRLRRIARGLTLEDVVDRLKASGAKPASKTSLSRWETGVDPVPRSVRPRLARILRCRVKDLA